MITGKSYGITNFIVTDRSGAVLMEKTVEVSGLGDKTVVVYRGADRETYSCTPMCSRRLTLGDHPEYLRKDARRNRHAQQPSQRRRRAAGGH